MSDETTAQVDALVGRIGVPTSDKRTIADLTIQPDPIPVRQAMAAGGAVIGSATATITDGGVIARITAAEAWTQRLLAGELHACMDTDHGKIVTSADGPMVLHDGTLMAITLAKAPNAWAGTWVKPVATRPETPELKRMSAVSDESQRIGEFLDWLVGHSRVVLARYRGDQLVPDYTDVNALLAQYFKIDLDKVDQERRALLAHLRSLGERS